MSCYKEWVRPNMDRRTIRHAQSTAGQAMLSTTFKLHVSKRELLLEMQAHVLVYDPALVPRVHYAPVLFQAKVGHKHNLTS